MFARSDDDGSVERFLVAEKVPLRLAKSGTTSALGKATIMWRHCRGIPLTCTDTVLDVDTVLPSSPGRRRTIKKYEDGKCVRVFGRLFPFHCVSFRPCPCRRGTRQTQPRAETDHGQDSDSGSGQEGGQDCESSLDLLAPLSASL